MKVMTAPPAGLFPLARDATSLGEPPPGSSGNIRTAAPVMHSQERAGRRLRHGFPQEQTMGNDNATTAAPGRRRILKCIAAAGAGTLWLMNGGVLKAYAMGDGKRGSAWALSGIALDALYRPGPMANIPTYCARKLGHERPDYIHPMAEPILRETFGVIIYQEQVMQIAQTLSGYSLGEADLLRRAMGKKIKKEMDAQRARFVSGAVERGLSQAKADEIFDLLAKFADYGFNKSHAAAYALVAYWTAWFKANHPAEFLAASMTLDKGNTDKLAEFRAEALRLGIPVAPPSVNASDVDFDVRVAEDGEPTIVYALSAVKGVGEAQAEALVAARAGRPFVSPGDLASRLASAHDCSPCPAHAGRSRRRARRHAAQSVGRPRAFLHPQPGHRDRQRRP